MRGLKLFRQKQNRMLRARRTPSGVRGLKFLRTVFTKFFSSRTPSGVRGLKFEGSDTFKVLLGVAPRQGCVD